MNNTFSDKNNALSKMLSSMKYIIIGVLFLLLINGVFATVVWTDLSTTDPDDWVGTSIVRSVAYANDGNIYTGIATGKFGRYSPTTNVWTDLSTTDPDDWVGTSSVNSVAYANDGNIYTGIAAGKFGRYSPTTNVWTDLSTTDPDDWVGTSSVNSVAYANDGNIYTGIVAGKFGRYSPTTNVWTDLSTTDPGNWVGTSSVNSVAYANDGNIYTGIASGKFGRYSPTTNVWTDLSTTDPGNWVGTSSVRSVAYANDGNIYTGIDDGKFGRYSPTTNVWTDLSTTDPGNWVGTSSVKSVAYANDGNIYTGIADGKFGRYSPTTNVWTDLSTTDPGNWVGTSIVRSVAYANDGNIYTGIASGKFGIYNLILPSDIIPPVTTLSGCTNGWKKTNQTITLTCNDNITGCNYTTYKLNNGADTNYTIPFVLSTDANHKIEYFSVDNNSNIESTKTSYCAIDKTNPTTSGAITGGTEGSNEWYTSNVTYTITPADATSGVASTVYCTDTTNTCTPTKTYSSAITLSTQSATNYVRFRSTDSAGNVQTVQSSGRIKIDKTNPYLGSLIIQGFDILDTSISGTGTIISTISDSLSGIKTCEYSIDGGSTWSSADKNTTHCYKEITIIPGTNYTFRLRTTDYAGNTTTGTSSTTYKGVDIQAPVTTFSSIQVPNTTDQNITLTCTDNTGCKTINYNINNEGWNLFNVTKTDTNTITTQNNTTTAVLSNTLLVNGYVADANFSFREIGTSGYARGFVQFIYFDGTDFNTDEQTVDGTSFVLKTFTNTSPTKIVSRINTYIRSSTNGQNKEGGTLTYSTTPQANYSFLYSGAGQNSIQYYSTDNSDNNETIKTSNFTTYGHIRFNMYDSANNELDGVGYSINPALNGVLSGVLTDNNLDLNLQGITTGTYTFTFTKPDYTTLTFTLPLTQYTDFDYNFILLDTNKTTNVNFQVFNESGAYANTKTFFAYDYSLDKYVGIQTTDTLGRLAFNLDQRKSDYNFFSTDFNFGTTVWNINKPKDARTLLDITGNWDYSITGASYSSASNIATGIQKLLLQNTVQPYTIKITDTAKNYIPTTFGLKSVTSETTKTLTPYLYKRGDADLKLIKLIDFSTNQPHSNPEELKLNLYNDINGLIPIGVFVNDSTGTYNIFMDKNATYELQVLSQSYTLRPTLDIYYLYLTENIDILIDNNLIVDANAPVMDANLPIIFMQVREVAFGCNIGEDNCYPSMIFSLIVIALLLIVLAISGQVGAISQSVSTGILLTIFLIVGFIPLWLFGVGVVILIAWGVFGQ